MTKSKISSYGCLVAILGILTPIGEGLDQILGFELLRSGSSKANTAAVAVVVLSLGR